MNLQQARESAGLTKKELADKLGVSDRTLYNWEKGRTPVTPMVVYAYAGACRVRVSSIIPGDAAGRIAG
jgi:transcriptional regulator with XRE-family HTH domain